MGAVALIVVLGGMVIPILVLLGTVLFDVGVISWAAYRLWHDRWMHRARHLVGRPGISPGAFPTGKA